MNMVAHKIPCKGTVNFNMKWRLSQIYFSQKKIKN